MRKGRSGSRGMTRAELMIVIGVLAVIVAIVVGAGAG